jgi:hypothetical protein
MKSPGVGHYDPWNHDLNNFVSFLLGDASQMSNI